MPRGPSRYLSSDSVKDRVRRMKASTPTRQRARQLAREGQTLEAMYVLLSEGDVTVAHVEAHERWLAENEHNDIV